jgi:hypothetical protein
MRGYDKTDFARIFRRVPANIAERAQNWPFRVDYATIFGGHREAGANSFNYCL